MTNTKTTENQVSTESEIWRIFKGRCLLNPSHPGETIHHVRFRSEGGDWDTLENQILLCNECHTLVHSKNTALWKCELVKLREEWIEKHGN